ncbi:MAG: hypothetical protein R3B47_11900 [Bacteroidia bacterium]
MHYGGPPAGLYHCGRSCTTNSTQPEAHLDIAGMALKQGPLARIARSHRLRVTPDAQLFTNFPNFFVSQI